MKLAQFIKINMESLLQDWQEAFLKIAPEMEGEHALALRDHARQMLEFVLRDIETVQTDAESRSKALSETPAFVLLAGKDHGIHRHKQGMSMLQLVQELRALRARITESWGDVQGGLSTKDINELVRFNEAIDQLMVTSVSTFSNLKDQVARLIDTMLKTSLDPVAVFKPDGKILFLNTAMAHFLNAPPHNVIGSTPRELGLDFAAEFHADIATTAITGEPQHHELQALSPSGDRLFYESQITPVFDQHNNVEAVVKIVRDISEQKLNEYQAWISANFDSLTGLPNRRLFIDRLEQAVQEAKRKGTSLALLFMDLDQFKQANDNFGHKTGDGLLRQVAERIQSKIRAMDTVARHGGDEFTVLLKDTDRAGAKEAAMALLKNLEEVFEVDSHQIHISSSIGLALFPHDGNDIDALIHHADQAMYAAKELGGQQVQFYESTMAQRESENSRLCRELDNALNEGQLEVYYQPIIDTRTGAISRAEALLRWNHPYKGLLAPIDFLGITELNGIRDKISSYVLEQAVACSLRWRDLSDETFPININESSASFFTPRLVAQWRARMLQVDLDDSSITLELTPDTLNSSHTAGFNPAKSLGLTGPQLHLSIDNFGIAPFSLSALQESRTESVKIDRELIKDAGRGGDADGVVEGIIAMAHAINIQVIGVGVENKEQLQFLCRAGCDYAQGYWFSRSLCENDFETMLRRDSEKHATQRPLA